MNEGDFVIVYGPSTMGSVETAKVIGIRDRSVEVSFFTYRRKGLHNLDGKLLGSTGYRVGHGEIIHVGYPKEGHHVIYCGNNTDYGLRKGDKVLLEMHDRDDGSRCICYVPEEIRDRVNAHDCEGYYDESNLGIYLDINTLCPSTAIETIKVINSHPFSIDLGTIKHHCIDWNNASVETKDGPGLVIAEFEKELAILVKSNKDPQRNIINYYHKSDVNLSKSGIITHCKAKVISYEKSSALFGLKNKKRRLKEDSLLHNIADIISEHKCKTDGVKRECILLDTHCGKLLYVKEDVEIVYPKINYIKKKDRTLKEGVSVKCVVDKTNTLKKGEVYIVSSINDVSHGNNYVVLRDKSGKIHVTFKKNVKVV